MVIGERLKDTLEKMARALEVSIYALFYDGEKPPAARWETQKFKGNELVCLAFGKDFNSAMRQTTALGPSSMRLLIHNDATSMPAFSAGSEPSPSIGTTGLGSMN